MTITEQAATDMVAKLEEDLKERARTIDVLTAKELDSALTEMGMDWFAPVLGMLKTETLATLFANLDRRRKVMEGLAEEMKKHAGQVEAELLPRFRNSGVQSVKVSGTTVYVERTLWGGAKDGNMPGLCEALKEMGLDAMVKEGVNAQTFSAYIREQEQALSKTPLPPEELIPKLPEVLQGVVNVSEVFKIRARKG